MISIIFALCVLLIGCGEVFVSTSGTGEIGGEGGTGGNSSTVSTTTSSKTSGSGGTSDTTSSSTISAGGTGGSIGTGGTGGSNLTFVDMPISNCEADYVFVPWSGYNLINSPAVSCVAVPKNTNSLAIKSFTYSLFKGSTDVPNVPLCDAVDHTAVWFTTTPLVSGGFDIPNDVILNDKAVQVDKLNWLNFVVPQFSGTAAFVQVTLDNIITISGDEIFCFGHKISENMKNDPTCLVSCLNQADYVQHSVSDMQNNPYHFVRAGAFSLENVNNNYTFVTLIEGSSILF